MEPPDTDFYHGLLNWRSHEIQRTLDCGLVPREHSHRVSYGNGVYRSDDGAQLEKSRSENV
jgi:hypothetical protein